MIYEDGYNKATRTTDNNDNRQPTTTTNNNNDRQQQQPSTDKSNAHVYSTGTAINSLWDASWVRLFSFVIMIIIITFRKCCGRVTKIYKSPAKTTLILSCDDEEVCVVTGFHSTKGVADVLKDCIVGKVFLKVVILYLF